MYCSDLIEIKRIVLVMFLRKIRTSFDCVKYLNLFVLYFVCSFTLFSSTAIFERDRLLYYKLNDCKWSVSCVHCCWPRCLGAGVSPPLVTITSPLASVECWQCRQADVRAVLSPAVPPHHNITVRLEPGESWKIDSPESMSSVLLNLTDLISVVKWNPCQVLTQWLTPVLATASCL